MSAQEASATLRFSLPVEVRVCVGIPVVPGTRAPREALERGRADRGYDDRRGYDPDFVGLHVALPTLTAKGLRRAARRVDVAPSDDDHVLRYQNYSVVMNRVRRFCYFTAANTTRDPKLVGTKSREDLTSTWIFDRRIAREHQVGHEEFYRPAVFDKGHVHRREDGYWGRTEAEREVGNADTFHFTNATPQHPGFNQSKKGGEWGALENHIAEQVGSQRYTVFAGPVFRADDPEVEGVLVPRRFWKVVVARKGAGLGAWAFVLDQSHLPFESALERFDPGRFVNRQVPVRALASLLDVRFDPVVGDVDAMRDADEHARVDLESLASIRGLR